MYGCDYADGEYSVRIAVSSGRGRRGNILNCLKMLESDIRLSLAGYSRILIKPNMVSAFRQLSATHVESIEAVLSFLRELKPDATIVIGEIPALGSFKEGCRNYGYEVLKEKYGVRLECLEGWPALEVRVFNRDFSTFRVPVVNPEGWYIVSVSPPKTHDTVLVTLSLKNIAMGLVKKTWKSKVHQGYEAINLNLYRISRFVRANLAVIDGYEAMEGDGPVNGDPVPWNMSIAGLNPVIVDVAASWLMGVNPWSVGYLNYALTFEHPKLTSETFNLQIAEYSTLKRKFRLHSRHREQYRWRIGFEVLERVKGILVSSTP